MLTKTVLKCIPNQLEMVSHTKPVSVTTQESSWILCEAMAYSCFVYLYKQKSSLFF